jgi:hypothetical protein
MIPLAFASETLAREINGAGLCMMSLTILTIAID